MNNKSKTNRRSRALGAYNRLQEQLRSGQYSVPDKDGNPRMVPADQIKRIREEIAILEKRYNF